MWFIENKKLKFISWNYNSCVLVYFNGMNKKHMQNIILCTVMFC